MRVSSAVAVLFLASFAMAADAPSVVIDDRKPKKKAMARVAPPVIQSTPKAYVPPGCAQCNTGNNQCACPLHYGSCRCGEVVKPAEVRPVPFGYPGFRHPGSADTTPGTIAPGAATFPRLEPAPGYRLAPATGFTGMPVQRVGRLSGGIGTSGCLTGG